HPQLRNSPPQTPCERLLSRLARKPEVRAMTPMVATGIVPYLGRLACAHFHTSAHPIRQPGRGKVDRVGMSPILILSLCVEIRIDTRCFVYFPWSRAGKNSNASHTAAQRQVHGQAIARNQTAVRPCTSARCSSTVDWLCSVFTFKPPDFSSFFNSSYK